MSDEQNEERVIGNILKQSDPANAYQFQQVQTPTLGNWTPEQRLLAALIEDAVLVIRHNRKMPGDNNRWGKNSRREAVLWVRSEDQQYPYSFNNACHALNINCEAARKAILGDEQ